MGLELSILQNSLRFLLCLFNDYSGINFLNFPFFKIKIPFDNTKICKDNSDKKENQGCCDKDNYVKYDKIIFTKKYGEPHEYVLFYNHWDAESYVNDSNLIRFNQSNWWWVDRFDKYYFVNDWSVKNLILENGDEINCKESKCLLVTSPGNAQDNWNKLETINFLDGQPVFEIYEN